MSESWIECMARHMLTWSISSKHFCCYSLWRRWYRVTRMFKTPWIVTNVKLCTNAYFCGSTKYKRSIYISNCMQTTFFYIERFLKKLVDYQFSSITKGSIYHIIHYVHAYFYHSSGLTRWKIWHLMEVYTMFYIYRYCVFT